MRKRLAPVSAGHPSYVVHCTSVVHCRSSSRECGRGNLTPAEASRAENCVGVLATRVRGVWCILRGHCPFAFFDLEEGAMRILPIEIYGGVNDHKLRAMVTGQIRSDGVARVQMRYSEIPPDWHPLNYSDPLALLPGYRPLTAGSGLMSLTSPAPAGFEAECTIDFGGGLQLRKCAAIWIKGGRIGWDRPYPKSTAATVRGGYILAGTARCGNIANIIRSTPDRPHVYEEFLHPAGPAEIMGIGHNQWPLAGGGSVDAIVSTRYRFRDRAGKALRVRLQQPLVRRLQIRRAEFESRRWLATFEYEATVDFFRPQ